MSGPSRPRLLVVEDEALVAMLIEDVLADDGFEVVGQAAKALTSLTDETVDAAILDVNLGSGEHSHSVAHELSERGIPTCSSPTTEGPALIPVTPMPPCCGSHSNPTPCAGWFTGCWHEKARLTD